MRRPTFFASAFVYTLILSAFLAFPSSAFARKTSMGFYLDIRGDETIKEKLLAKLQSLPCFEEADLHSIEIYETSKEPGGECHAFRTFRQSASGHYAFCCLLRIDLKDSVKGRRSFRLRGYVLRGKKVEPDFDAGTYRLRDAGFVNEAANQIVIRTFMLPPPESVQRRFDPDPLDSVPIP